MTQIGIMLILAVLAIPGYITPQDCCSAKCDKQLSSADEEIKSELDTKGPLPEGAGVLVMAHGGDEMWNGAVEAAVAPMSELVPTEIAFGMARTSTMREAIERLEAQGVVNIAVVRMFISGDSFLDRTETILGLREYVPPDIHAMLGIGAEHVMEPAEPVESEANFYISSAGVGESILIDQILIDRVIALSVDPENESVLILAHGPGDDDENERWLTNLRARSSMVSDLGFQNVYCETLREDWDDKRIESEKRIREFVERETADGRRVIVLPFRVAGFGPYDDVLDGLDYVADRLGFCPHPNMTRWIEETMWECFAEK